MTPTQSVPFHRDAPVSLLCHLLNAAERLHLGPSLTPARILRAYSLGLFPMGRAASDRRIAWFYPDPRGILPLAAFHVSRRLAETVGSGLYRVTVDRDFAAVIDACARSGTEGAEPWINAAIRAAWVALHQAGYAHSIEVWHETEFAGGLYGVALGGAFFAESMFGGQRDASKVALVHLAARLRHGGFVLLDTQFGSEHLTQFGGIAIPRLQYRAHLAAALRHEGRFDSGDDASAALAALLRPSR